MMEGCSKEKSILCHAPRDLNYLKFAENRALEIEAMASAIEGGKRNKQAHQQLPKHMRRRAMSHNVKRLPRRLHKQAQRDMATCPPKPISKRPSRKYRRRPRNLMAEYKRRQRNNVWLETHIWHAKRFKMLEKWGYKIPLHPNDKSIRASYRAAAYHSLLIDVSYLCCIELCGSVEDIVEGFCNISSAETGILIDDEEYLNGDKQGELMMYKIGMYPSGAICPINFIWKPSEEDTISPNKDTETRNLWLWVHPSSYNEVMFELGKAFLMDDDDLKQFQVEDTKGPLTTEMIENGSGEPTNKMPKLCTDDINEDLKNINPCIRNEKVIITSLKDELNRYRLIGPKSPLILSDTLKPASISSNHRHQSDSSNRWWQNYYSCEKNLGDFKKQVELWQEFSKRGNSLRNHNIWYLTVTDPRLDMPKKRTFLDEDECSSVSDKQAECMELDITSSPLWHPAVRQNVKINQMTTHQLNLKRSALLIPGSRLDLGEEESRIPIMLVQNGSNCDNDGHGYGCYIDVIVPSGWGMSFWLAFVYRGGRAGGLRELENVIADSGNLVFPKHFPDTQAGKNYSEKHRSDMNDILYRKPPGKRTPFNAMGILAPFHCPWLELTSEWSTENSEDTYCVIRSHEKLQVLSQSSDDLNSAAIAKSLLTKSVNLVCVQLKMLNKGAPPEFSVVCLPDQQDMRQLKRDINFGGPIEEQSHNEVRENYISELKREGKSFKPAIRELQKLKDVNNVKDCCSRTCIGFVVHGGYCFNVGAGACLAYCVLPGLLEAMQQKNHVLVRSPFSRQYRFATFSINK